MGAYLYIINKDENGDPISPPILKSIAEKKGVFKTPVIKNDLGNGMIEIIQRGYVYEHSLSLRELHKLYNTDKAHFFFDYDWTDPENPVIIQSKVDEKVKELKLRHAKDQYKKDITSSFDTQNPIHVKLLMRMDRELTELEKDSIITDYETNHDPENEYWLKPSPDIKAKAKIK